MKLWKFLLPVTLCLVLAVLFLPATARATAVTDSMGMDSSNATVNATEHIAHPACGATCNHEQTHETVTATRWTGATMYEGAYYMAYNMTRYTDLVITKNTRLCLNGFKLTFAEGYGIVVQSGASLEICDCKGTGEIARGTRVSGSDCSIIGNQGTMTLYGGKYCMNGAGVSVFNDGTAYIYGGTYGIRFSNYKTATIYQATFAAENVPQYDEAIYNADSATLTIHDCTVNSNWGALRNEGTAKINGGTYQMTNTSTVNFLECVYNRGYMQIKNATIRATGGYGIFNDYNSSSYNSGTLYFSSGTVEADTTRGAAIYNRRSATIYDGTFHGYVGLKNASALTGTTENGGTCTVSGGTFTGTLCGIHNSGNSYTQYVNGVGTRRYSKAILTIDYSPSISKLLLDYPDAVGFNYTGTEPIDLEVNTEDIAVGETLLSAGRAALPLVNLVTDGYVAVYNYSAGIILADNYCGDQGDNLRWKLTKDGVLTISGTGAMRDFSVSTNQPWNKSKTGIDVMQIVIQSGVTTIGSAAFGYLPSLTKVELQEGVEKIGNWAFEHSNALQELWLPSTLLYVSGSAFAGCKTLPEAVHYAGCIHQWNAVSGAASLALTPITEQNENRDDGDCTTQLLCSVCGGVDVAAREAHTGGTADCTTLAQCEVCGKSYGTYLHNILEYAAQAPTCTAVGWNAYESCALCDYSTYEELPMLPHVFQATYSWSEDHTGCQIALTCDCGKRTFAEATVTVDNTQPATTVHTATLEYNGQSFTDIRTCQNYLVQFVNWDGTVLEAQYYHPGATVTLPTDPSKETDHLASYRFAGWDRPVEACAGDATYTATYTPEYISYTVRFVDDDGSELSKGTYHWGDAVTPPATPVKEADHMASYRFAGWDRPVEACAGDATYTATYTPEYIAYTVRFVNDDGSELSKGTYHWGDAVTLPATPVKEADHMASYRFAGWDKPVEACTGDATYTATYTPIYVDYMVRFVDADGKELSKGFYHWGDPVVPPADPVKTADNTYTYRFSGWDKPVVNCAGSTVYTATYTAEYITYTVTFRYADGTVIRQLFLHYGDEVMAPEAPAVPESLGARYEFAGWDKTVTACCADAEYTAVFAEKYLPGDVDGNEMLDTDDAVYLLLYIMFGGEDFPILSGMEPDFDGNGTLDTDDAVYLLLHVMFGEADFPLAA